MAADERIKGSVLKGYQTERAELSVAEVAARIGWAEAMARDCLEELVFDGYLVKRRGPREKDGRRVSVALYQLNPEDRRPALPDHFRFERAWWQAPTGGARSIIERVYTPCYGYFGRATRVGVSEDYESVSSSAPHHAWASHLGEARAIEFIKREAAGSELEVEIEVHGPYKTAVVKAPIARLVGFAEWVKNREFDGMIASRRRA
jgi:hypothetical protein